MSAEVISKEADRIKHMFSSVASRYDLTNSVLSMGIHYYWRKVLLKNVRAPTNEKALDLCTGTGDLLLPLKRQFKQVIGVDFCKPMLALAAKKISADSTGIELMEGDALDLKFPDNLFDLVTVAFGVRNFENLERGLAEMRRVCKPGGQILILEFGAPRYSLWRALYRLYSSYILPSIGGILTGDKSAYSYLNRSTLNFPCAEDFILRLRSSGFVNGSFQTLTGGVAYLYSAFKD